MSLAKIRENIFVGSYTGEVIKDLTSVEKLSNLERARWKSFVANFLGDHKSDRYRELIREIFLTH